MRCFLPLLFLLPGAVAAQPEVPRFTFKLNVSPLLNPSKQALAFATDVRVAPRLSVDAGAGAFLGSRAFASEQGEYYRGLRLRAGFKYYFSQRDGSDIHVGIEGKYHDIRHHSFREAFRQGRQYVEWLPVDRKVRTYGVAARMGWMNYFGRKQQFLAEPFLGIGYLAHRVTSSLPPDAELVGEGEDERVPTIEYETGRSSSADILIGLHLGVVLW